MAEIDSLAEPSDPGGTYSTFNGTSGTSDDDDGGGGTFTAEEAIECVGFGRFQVFVGLGAGLAWVADGMEIMVISILGPVMLCEWGITVYDEALLTTVVFLGLMVGSPLLGWFTDKYGRRLGLTVACTWITITGILSGLAPTLYWLISFRFLVGIGIAGEPQAITYFAEFLPNRSRGRCLILAAVFFVFGGSLSVLLAIAILVPYGWRWWLGACAAPSFIFVVFCLVFGYWLEWFPRSPRYDLITGNTDNALRTLQMAARWNRTRLPKGKLIPEPEVPRGRVLDLLRPGYKLTSCLLIVLWFSAAFTYYGIALFTTQMVAIGNTCDPENFELAANGTCQALTVSDYTNLFWTSTADLPGLVLTAVLVDLIGRKPSLISGSLAFAITSMLLFICMQLVPMLVLLYIARTFTGASYQVLYVYTPEVYPTEVRALAIGMGAMFSRVGAMVTPYVAQVLLSYSMYYAVGIYAGMGFVNAFAALFLPYETKGMSLKAHG